MSSGQISRKVIEQIAFDLKGYEIPVAFLKSGEKVLWASLADQGIAPLSPVVKLIQGIFDQYIDHSFFYLRERIYTTLPLSEMDQGLVKLTAKRATGEIQCSDHQLDIRQVYPQIEFEEMVTDWVFEKSKHIQTPSLPHPLVIRDDQSAFLFLDQLIQKIPRGEVLHDYNRPIAAVLLNERDEVLSFSTNSNFKNKSFHAEVLCIQRAYRLGHIQRSDRLKLYVNLKPCRMCAGMLAHLKKDLNKIEVIYKTNDPGPLARGSSLEKLGRLRLFRD